MNSPSRLPLAVAMWLAGMLGVVVVVLWVLPSLVAGRALPVPFWLLSAIGLVQGAVFLALAVWAGVALAPKVGLRAPVFEALVGSASVAAALRPQWVPGLLGGLAGGAFLVVLSYATPAALVAAGQDISLPLSARILYGGITEELLLRWGFMSLLLWLLWRFVRRAPRLPSAGLVWMAIIGSALLFGVGHLPAAHAVVGDLDFRVVSYVVGGNAAFSVLAGWLFWRFGLESSMLAHGVAHVVLVLYIGTAR